MRIPHRYSCVSVMEDSPSRTEQSNRAQAQSLQSSKMSMLAMVTPSPHAPFRREYSWDESRSADMASSRPRTEPERIALPSIRQVFECYGKSFSCSMINHSNVGVPRAPASCSTPRGVSKDSVQQHYFTCGGLGWHHDATRVHSLSEF